MDVIYWLIPLSVAVLVVAVLILFWAVKNGQFQDLDSPAVDILFDDDEQPGQPKPNPPQLNSVQLESNKDQSD